jgi:hypothetical protein
MARARQRRSNSSACPAWRCPTSAFCLSNRLAVNVQIVRWRGPVKAGGTAEGRILIHFGAYVSMKSEALLATFEFQSDDKVAKVSREKMEKLADISGKF